MGAGQPRDLNIVGRGYENILFAMDYLRAQNILCNNEPVDESAIITAKNKVVAVIGGGDTGSDCVGTARRQGAKEIYQLEILPQPPRQRPPDTPWPMWPRIMRTTTSHEEGCNRQWSVMTRKFSGVEARLTQLHCCRVEWFQKNGTWQLNELPGTEFTLDADMAILATGFLHVAHNGLVKELELRLDRTGNVAVENSQTSRPDVFAAGDTVHGASLVVRAIDSGRQTAAAIDNWLKSQA